MSLGGYFYNLEDNNSLSLASILSHFSDFLQPTCYFIKNRKDFT